MTARVFVPTFGEYQAVAMKTAAIYPRTPAPAGNHVQTIPVYPAMAALGESGELCEKILDGARVQLPYLKELGDVLWYVTAAAVELRLADPGHELGAALCSPYCNSDTTFADWAARQDARGFDPRGEALRLVACLGRYAERVKKCWRENTVLSVNDCAVDLSRALVQLHAIALCFYSTIGEVAQANVDKLISRRSRGTLLGSGDDR